MRGTVGPKLRAIAQVVFSSLCDCVAETSRLQTHLPQIRMRRPLGCSRWGGYGNASGKAVCDHHPGHYQPLHASSETDRLETGWVAQPGRGLRSNRLFAVSKPHHPGDGGHGRPEPAQGPDAGARRLHASTRARSTAGVRGTASRSWLDPSEQD